MRKSRSLRLFSLRRPIGFGLAAMLGLCLGAWIITRHCMDRPPPICPFCLNTNYPALTSAANHFLLSDQRQSWQPALPESAPEPEAKNPPASGRSLELIALRPSLPALIKITPIRGPPA